MFLVFQLFSYIYWFHLDVSKVDLMLQQVFHMHVSSVSSTSRLMLQVLHLDILKLDPVLHLPRYFSTASHRCLFLLRRWLGIRRPLPLSRC